jgi:hypothetical protein
VADALSQILVDAALICALCDVTENAFGSKPDTRFQQIPNVIPTALHNSKNTRFCLLQAARAVSLLSDRSRLVLPNESIAKVRLAWCGSRYRRSTKS